MLASSEQRRTLLLLLLLLLLRGHVLLPKGLDCCCKTLQPRHLPPCRLSKLT